jgi:hypothetical protein
MYLEWKLQPSSALSLCMRLKTLLIWWFWLRPFH